MRLKSSSFAEAADSDILTAAQDRHLEREAALIREPFVQ
jgi:hypothetical protein